MAKVIIESSSSLEINKISVCGQVSWIRLSDIKLLTVGRYTYTTDLRFEGIHQKYSPDWKLILNEASVKDSGKIALVILLMLPKSFVWISLLSTLLTTFPLKT